MGPAIVFAYFGVAAVVSRLLASPVAALTARVQAGEGDFRAVHASLLVSRQGREPWSFRLHAAQQPPFESLWRQAASESTALCSNGAAERVALSESFCALLLLRWRLVVGPTRVSNLLPPHLVASL